MIKETLDGQTHYYGDGCKEHPIEDEPKYMSEWEKELDKLIGTELTEYKYDLLIKFIKKLIN